MARLARDYPGVQRNGWRVWPLASFLNYRFVPLQLRVLFVNLVALCWCVGAALAGWGEASQAAMGMQCMSVRAQSHASHALTCLQLAGPPSSS